LNAFLERKDAITGLVYVCAKINAPASVSAETYRRNPAFKTSLYTLQDNLKRLTPADKARLHSFYSPVDARTPHAATVIPGVRETKLPALRHGRAILYSLSLGASTLLHPLKELAASDLRDAA
jgi:hypothetical protein